jgi:murein L,D-transpeptidase YcbB/YkuD
MRRLNRLFVATVLTASVLTVIGHPVNAQQSADIAKLVQRLGQSNGRQFGSYHIAAHKFLQRFYAARQNRPAWIRRENALSLASAVADAPSDGLLVQDFHPGALGLASAKSTQHKLSAAERDIVLSDAFIRLLYQLHYGKVSPERFDTNWNFERKAPSGKSEALISAALDTGEVGTLISAARPSGPYHQIMRTALSTYRTHLSRGGWSTITSGPALKPGIQAPRIAAIRKRLSITGEYGATTPETVDLYDAGLVEAVGQFQSKHGIDVDGVIGPGTIRAMNVSAETRINQIRVNIERGRWIDQALKGKKDLVIVNAAGFYLLTVLNGKFVWWTDVITGKPYHKTPLFTDNIKYVEFNPTWTIPGGILRNEVLPKLRANPGYLAAKGYDLIGSNGQKVDPAGIDWATMSGRGFPYRVVQPPGPKNALGLVKFIFPNKHNVYLHDTPSRQLFNKTGRAFSHGCVRVKDPMKFAEVLLGNRNGMTRAQIDRIVTSKKLTRVNLKKTIPVAILYWTADPVWQGGIRFYQDVYKRDARVLKALDAPFRLPNR